MSEGKSVDEAYDVWRKDDFLFSLIPEPGLAVWRAAWAARGEYDLKVVEAEEELPGGLPDEMWADWQNLDRSGIEHMLRVAVRETKAGIAARIKGEQV